MAFRKAERKKAKLRMGIIGASGSGKTYSALQIAYGLGGRIAMIDTESGSGDLYAHTGEYDICNISSPYLPKKYIQAIKEAEDEGYNVIIIDSLSHAWVGEGGLLDVHGALADKGGNSFAAWRKVTPEHNALVEAMLQSKCHVIATMRAKTEYVQDNDRGKTVVRKVGMAPVQRDGMEYEFTVVFDLSAEHQASASKDRTSMFDGQFFKPSLETGRQLLAWLDTGIEAPVVKAKEAPPPQPAKSLYAATQAQPSQPASGGEQGNMKSFWSSVHAMGYDEAQVHAVAGVDSIVGFTQKQLNDLMKELARLKQEKATA